MPYKPKHKKEIKPMTQEEIDADEAWVDALLECTGYYKMQRKRDAKAAKARRNEELYPTPGGDCNY